MQNLNLASFLSLGYFLDYDLGVNKIDLSGVDRSRYASATEQELIAIGSDLLRSAIAADYKSGQSNVVPISGGLDSRAILAGLLEHTDASAIYTYTFGTPGSSDYEIGCEVAKRLGTKHTAFDLTKYLYRQEELEDISRRVDHQTVLFHHWPVWEVDKQFCGASVWSGYLGETLSGSHLHSKPALDLPTAIAQFFHKNQFVRPRSLNAKELDFAALLELPTVPATEVTLEEQLDLFNRQPKYISPLVLIKGYEWNAPFKNQPWINFILSVHNCHRQKQKLYKKILLSAFSGEFAIRTKANHGFALQTDSRLARVCRAALNLLRRSPDVNYIDFSSAIRGSVHLSNLLASNIADLSERGILENLEPLKVFEQHMDGVANNASALLVLASLEIHLKAGKVLR